MPCRHHRQKSRASGQDEEGPTTPGAVATERKKNPRGLDIAIRFFDNYNRTMDSLKKSLDVLKEKQHEMDAAVNFGVGYVEDKKLTHGISMGGVNSGVYGGIDLVYNKNQKEYLVLTKKGDILKYDWAGVKLNPVTPTKKFSRFIHIPQTGHYLCYNPGKSFFYILREDLTVAMDTVSIMPIQKIVYSGRKPDENVFDFFIVSGATMNKYSYNPSSNGVSLQECIKISDIEVEKSEIDQVCFDQPMDDKKQWVYMTFKQHVAIIDVSGRVHGTKKHLHQHKITAIVAYGASEFVVTGDEKGLLKMWGTRWMPITEIHPHSAKVTHMIEHPNGRAVVSFSSDQTIFAWSLDSKLKLESMKSPEIVERIAINQDMKAFMALGPRKLVIWKMDVLFSPHTPMSAPISRTELTWNPDIPPRAVVCSRDNAIRIINPVTGRILKSALVNPPKPPLSSVVYVPQYEAIYALKTAPEDLNSLEIQIFDGTTNPCRLKETWNETKWDTAITAIALYDLHQSILVAEKGVVFSTKKQVEITGSVTFLICGMRDGCLCKVDLHTGNIEYKVPCHKGQVNQIEINPEVNQFVSLGVEPNVRLWKVAVNQDDMFIPLFDISWKYPIRHVTLVREVISFALSHHDSSTHKVVMFNTSETERYDHRQHFAHQKEILSLSSCKELLLFCSASSDETVRIWNDKCDLVRLLALNWLPVFAGFGTRQGDLFIGIDNYLHVVPADKYLSVIYRNRAMMSGLSAGPKEKSTPLNATRSGQDPRMYLVLEEEDRYEREAKEREKEREKDKKVVGPAGQNERLRKQEDEMLDIKIPPVGTFHEPKDSQRAKEYEKYRSLDEDLKSIVDGNHQFSIFVPDFRKMTKKQLDDYGKTIFPEDGDKRKMFASESRIACVNEMAKNAKELDNYDDGFVF